MANTSPLRCATGGCSLPPIAVNAVVYSYYYVTALHPRFLNVTLPFVFVLEATGGVALTDAIRRRKALARKVRVL